MKIYILIALFILTFSFNSPVLPAYAQSGNTVFSPSSQTSIDTPETDIAIAPSSSEENNKGNNSFANATDEQIKETNYFYVSCTENETMNKLRDCKCAATAYLDKKMELGDKATIKEILDANSDKCLKGDDNILTHDGDDDFDPSTVTDAQLKESDEILLKCKSKLKLSRYYDCECYAAKFLDERIKRGPFASKESIIQSFYNECRNIVETTGYEYTYCMKNILINPVRGHEPKPFCECYARRWAKIFEEYEGTIDIDSKGLMRRQARAFCVYRKR